MSAAKASIYAAFAPFQEAQRQAIGEVETLEKRILHLQKTLSHVLRAHNFTEDIIKRVRDLEIEYLYAADGSVQIMDNLVAEDIGDETVAEYEARTGTKVFREEVQ